MNRLEIIPSKALKNGMASAMIQATIVMAAMSNIQTVQPFLSWMNRISELGNARFMIYRPTTVLLMLPLMKMTGNAMPKATLEISGPALNSAGLLTSLPTNRYT
jgi:hypothetical protein